MPNGKKSSKADKLNNLDHLIVRAFYWIDKSLHLTMRERGGPTISHSQSMIIMAIGDGITRPSAIADRLGVSRQAIHQSIRELVGLGLVQLMPDPDDGRAKLAKLSPTGAPTHQLAYDILTELEKELGKRIGTDQVKALRKALQMDWGEPVLLK